jgi:flagellar biogenesis protein FliO
MNYSGEIIKIALYLTITIIIIVLFINLLKKSFPLQRKGQNMEVIEQLYIAPKKSLILLQIKEKILLISVSDNRTEKLHEWDITEFGEFASEENQNFKSYLNRFFNRNRCDKDV